MIHEAGDVEAEDPFVEVNSKPGRPLNHVRILVSPQLWSKNRRGDDCLWGKRIQTEKALKEVATRELYVRIRDDYPLRKGHGLHIFLETPSSPAVIPEIGSRRENGDAEVLVSQAGKRWINRLVRAIVHDDNPKSIASSLVQGLSNKSSDVFFAVKIDANNKGQRSGRDSASDRTWTGTQVTGIAVALR